MSGLPDIASASRPSVATDNSLQCAEASHPIRGSSQEHFQDMTSPVERKEMTSSEPTNSVPVVLTVGKEEGLGNRKKQPTTGRETRVRKDGRKGEEG